MNWNYSISGNQREKERESKKIIIQKDETGESKFRMTFFQLKWEKLPLNQTIKRIYTGSSFGSVGRAVASETSTQKFESTHLKFSFTISCIESASKDQNKGKRGLEWPSFFKSTSSKIRLSCIHFKCT